MNSCFLLCRQPLENRKTQQQTFGNSKKILLRRDPAEQTAETVRGHLIPPPTSNSSNLQFLQPSIPPTFNSSNLRFDTLPYIPPHHRLPSVTNFFSADTCLPCFFLSLFIYDQTDVYHKANMPFTYAYLVFTLQFTCVRLMANTFLLPI